MAILKLPKTATHSMVHEGPEESDYVVLDVPVESIVFTQITAQAADEFVDQVSIRFGRPLTFAETCVLPPHYEVRNSVLTRQADRGLINPSTGYRWSPMLMIIDGKRGELSDDPLITLSPVVKQTRYCELGIYLTEYGSLRSHLDKRNPMVSNVAARLSDILFDWKSLPCNIRTPYWLGSDLLKLNKFDKTLNALFPKKYLPTFEELNAEPEPTKGRAWTFMEAPDRDMPVALSTTFFPELTTCMTLGVRDDWQGYRPLRMPETVSRHMADYGHELGTWPVSRVLIYKTPKAFHFLFMMLVHLEVSPSTKRTTPFLYTIPIVVPQSEVSKGPTLIRGLTPAMNDELAKCRGLTNAMKRALNALMGEKLKLDRDSMNLNCMNYGDFWSKPRHHTLFCLAASRGMGPYEVGYQLVPAAFGAASLILDHAVDKWGRTMVSRGEEELSPSELQRVAPEQKRALDV